MKVVNRSKDKCDFPKCAGIDMDRMVFVKDACGLCGKEILVCMEHHDTYGVTLRGRAARGTMCCARNGHTAQMARRGGL